MDGSLLFSVFIFLAAASLLVPVSKLSGLGSIIGYLFAGVLIGPSVLGLIDNPDTILHFSEFGVVMMLFIIGLELRPAELWKMRMRLVGLGGLQVILTTAAITGAALLLGVALPSALVLGMALALSSTAIVMQILEEKGIFQTQTGQSGFSVLLFQDVIVIAMISALPFIAAMNGADVGGADLAHPPYAEDDGHGGGGHTMRPEGLLYPLAILGVFGGMVLLGRFVLRPVFRLITRSRVRETFTALALLLVIGSALLMEWLGLSAALGAFFSGVVLADSEYRHQLERDIEPFKALLLGLFFMSVGMTLQLGQIAQEPFLIGGIVIGLMALKFAVLYIVGMIFSLRRVSDLLFATLLCQAGEFGFVLFQFAVTEGAIASELASRFNSVIALTMALTPLLVLGYDRLVAPRFNPPKKTGESPAGQHNRVIILGYGRVGQVVSRFLHSQGFDMTLIDHDGDHIEFTRQFGSRVFYGDATDMDLLQQAGADKADIIVIAIDNVEKAVRAAHDIRQHFPKAKIIARARNRGHMYDLMSEEVDFAERETFRGSIAMGRKALEFMGYSESRARRLGEKFLKLDYENLVENYHMRGDMAAMRQHALRYRALLQQTLQSDEADQDSEHTPGEN